MIGNTAIAELLYYRPNMAHYKSVKDLHGWQWYIVRLNVLKFRLRAWTN